MNAGKSSLLSQPPADTGVSTVSAGASSGGRRSKTRRSSQNLEAKAI